jgi:hypothetical protein
MRASSRGAMLDERPDEFDARNLFFQAVLGFVSFSRRLDAAIERQAPGEPAPEGDPFLLFTLGLVAFRRRAARWVEGAAPEPRPEASSGSPPEPARAERAPLGDLLR